MNPCFDLNRPRFIALALAAAVVLVFGRTGGFEFVDMDDGMYVIDNVHVARGLTVDGVRWAFSTFYAANWHPLTWISHMADVELFGFWPGGHHLMSVAWHLAATLVLFKALREMTGETGLSAVVAAVFAIHPLHVESVAWVSERKDVLCGFFWMTGLWAWGRYCRKETRGWYAAAAFLLVLALLSKPMAVTFPFVLLLVDIWPLRRRHRGWGVLIREKAVLITLAAAAAVVTLAAQSRWGAVGSMEAFPLAVRAANALVSCATYIVNAVVPVGLAAYYPHRGHGLPVWQVTAAGALLLALTAMSLRLRAGHPYLLTGWLWFVGMLVPVVGLVQVGSQAMADRYTYLPLVGLSIMAVGAGSHWAVSWGRRRQAGMIAVGWILVMAVAAFWQVGYWQNSILLFNRMITAGGPSAKAHHGLGAAFNRQGRYAQALAHLDEALAIKPDDARIRNDTGLALLGLHLATEAEWQFRRSLAIDPLRAGVHNNLGVALVQQGRIDEAMASFQQALNLDSTLPGAADNLANARVETGKSEHRGQGIEGARR